METNQERRNHLVPRTVRWTGIHALHIVGHFQKRSSVSRETDRSKYGETSNSEFLCSPGLSPLRDEHRSLLFSSPQTKFPTRLSHQESVVLISNFQLSPTALPACGYLWKACYGLRTPGLRNFSPPNMHSKTDGNIWPYIFSLLASSLK